MHSSKFLHSQAEYAACQKGTMPLNVCLKTSNPEPETTKKNPSDGFAFN